MQQSHVHMSCVAFEASHNHMFFDLASEGIFTCDTSLSNSPFLQLETQIFGSQIAERNECYT